VNENALTAIMRQFASGEMDALQFTESYMAAWRRWRDEGGGSDTFDKAFTAADCFSSEQKNAANISADRLKAEVIQLLSEISS